MNDVIVQDVWGFRTSSWLAFPSWGTSSDILLIQYENKLDVLEYQIEAFSISYVDEWVFLSVHDSSNSQEVDDFLIELDDIKAWWDLPQCLGRILI